MDTQKKSLSLSIEFESWVSTQNSSKMSYSTQTQTQNSFKMRLKLNTQLIFFWVPTYGFKYDAFRWLRWRPDDRFGSSWQNRIDSIEFDLRSTFGSEVSVYIFLVIIYSITFNVHVNILSGLKPSFRYFKAKFRKLCVFKNFDFEKKIKLFFKKTTKVKIFCVLYHLSISYIFTKLTKKLSLK